jgi:ABC-type phosphate transport system substrate-binding protein
MGARVESLRIPAGRPGRRFNWLAVGVLAASMAVAASILALQRGSSESSAPPLSVVKAAPAQAITRTGSELFRPAYASLNNTGHSLVYFTGAGGVINSMANKTGHGIAWFTGRVAPQDLGAYDSAGSAARSDRASRSDPTCRRIIRPRC